MVASTNRLSPLAFDRLDDFVQKSLGNVFPAMQLAVFHRGACVLNVSWKATVTTLFDLASVSKLFTVTAFLAQVSDSNIGLDDPLVTVIPEFGNLRVIGETQNPHTEAMFPLAEDALGEAVYPGQVTFRHLLTHTSGLAPWRNIFRVAGPVPPADGVDVVSRQERWQNALREICAYPFVDRIGRQVHYSDLGLMLLGEAVARLDGQSLEAVIRKRITVPLGLQSIQYNPLQHGAAREGIAPTEDDTRWRKRRCWGEVHDENACSLGGIAGHAGLFGTALDVARFGQAWLEKSDALGVDPQLMRSAIQEQASGNGHRRGLGWMLKHGASPACGDQFGARSYGHNGYTGTSLWIDPDASLVVACLTNRVYFGRDDSGISEFRPRLHNLIHELVKPQ